MTIKSPTVGILVVGGPIPGLLGMRLAEGKLNSQEILACYAASAGLSVEAFRDWFRAVV